MRRDAPRPISEIFQPEAPESTELRRILARIERLGEERPLKSLLFTSAEQGEGKTTLASLLAMVACLHRELRVCLVDADLRRPRLASLFEVDGTPGLSEVLRDDVPLESVLRLTQHRNLTLIPAGGECGEPSELLLPSRLSAVFRKLSLLFDLTVVDAPPLLPVSDPALISQETDGVVLVVRAGRTQRAVVSRAGSILDDVGARVLGVIVNNVDDVLPYYYGHSYYRGSYGEAREGGRRTDGQDPETEPGGEPPAGRNASHRGKKRAGRARARVPDAG